ncbi:GrpB family protein [Halosimplex marinum]|uniref:GrpB family protein n=1 Tax=Halosimplex marinum TaxID=3396620 RepID=UPI003F54C9CD
MDETPIEIVDHDPAWSDRFRAERDRIGPLVEEYATRIDHIGSTSVPGLAAKPIVDCMAVVGDSDGLVGNVDRLSTWFGYEISHVPGDWLLLQREDDDGQAYNLHLIPESREEWQRNLRFREYLRRYPEARAEYESVKREAAAAHPENIDGYNDAKSDCVQSILEDARADESVTVPEANADT